jgi:thioredoxin reductase (NADPH)
VSAVAKPVVVVVDDEDASLRLLTSELESRYGAHYRIVASSSAQEALAQLAELRAEGARVPVILTDQWLPGNTGTELLGRARDIYPAARRGLLISWGDRSAADPIFKAAALGQIDFFLPKPAWTPDEQFHLAVTEALEGWWRQQGRRFEAVTVIGEERSARAHQIRDVLTRTSVPFGFHPKGSAEGQAALERLGVREAAGPVVALYDGTVLVDPSLAEMGAALGVDIRPAQRTYDLAIVGAGPAGLAAAVYGASEGLSTALLEREAFGGQAGTSSLIRNYPGFPWGVGGADLALRAYQQAWLFGAHFVYANPAASLAEDADLRVVGLADGSEVRSRAVVIATGASYRRLGVPELEALVGAGVFYGAATVEAQAVAGKPAFVVGGGNSAGQAALHLAKHAGQVTILVRSASLAASMSAYLIQEIDNAPNVEVRYRAEVTGGGGDRRLEHLELRDQGSGTVESVSAAGLFVLIGTEPFTHWLPGAVGRDRWGFVLTGPDTGKRWPLERAPYLFETSLPGVFAAGDVRHGSVKRVASAVGEGSIAIRQIHEYLALTPSHLDVDSAGRGTIARRGQASGRSDPVHH